MDREKAQKFRLLWKQGETDEALSIATRFFNDSLVAEDLHGAAQALIFISHILLPIGGSENLKKSIRKLRDLSVKKQDLTPYIWFLRGYTVILLEGGKLKEASALIKEISDMGWEGVARMSKAHLALVRGEPAYALEILLEGNEPRDPMHILLKAEVIAGMGRFRESMELLMNTSWDNVVAEAMKNDILGFCSIGMGDYERAKIYFNRAVEPVKGAHGAPMELSASLASLGIIFAIEGDIDKAKLYLELAENSAARMGRLKTTLEIRAAKEAVLSEGGNSLMRAQEIEAEAKIRGFGVAMLWAIWAKIAAGIELGLKQEPLEHIKILVNLAREHELWGYLSYIAQAAPGPLGLILSVYPDDRDLKEIANRVGTHREKDRVRLLVMGRPALETSHGLFPLKRDRVSELLIFFGLHGKGELTREMIIQKFWPQLPPERSKRNYYKFTALARAILKKHGVKLKPHKSRDSAWIGCDIQSDLDELRNLLNAARAAEASAPAHVARPIYERALSLIRGDFLEGWSDFLEDVRDEARELINLVYMRMAEYLLDEDPEQAMMLAEKVLSLRHFSEEACEIAIKALLRFGRPERARKLYENFTKRFRAELMMESRLMWPPEEDGR